MIDYDIILIDGSSYLFRAYHALPPLENKEGMPTGAIFGVLNMIKKLQATYSNSKIIIVFDPKGGSFRNEMYEEYKSNRGKTPDDLVVQIPILQDIIIKMGLPLLVKDGYEADDVIASLVKLASGKNVLISTLDKDLAQLVTPKVHLINTMHNKLLNSEAVEEKFGVRPDQMRDYLALIGDRSDNVPGITGVGPKTAAKWLGLYNDLEGLKRHKENLKGKVGENFRIEEGQLDLSAQLISLAHDIHMADSIDQVVGQPIDKASLKVWFARLGFKRWLSEIQEDVDVPYSVLATESALKRALKKVLDASSIVFSYAKDDPEKVGFSVKGRCFIVDASLIDLDVFFSLFVDAIKGKRFVGHDIKGFFHLLANHQAQRPDCDWCDMMLMSYVLDSSKGGNLEDLVTRYFDNALLSHVDDDAETVLAKQAINLEKLSSMIGSILKEKEDVYLYEKVEMPTMHVLTQMEQNGAYVDSDLLASYALELKQTLQDIENQVHEQVGEVFNLASPKQVGIVLFEKLGLPIVSKTPGGEPSTAESVLQTLKDAHSCIPLLLKHRTLSKIKSTYADVLPKQVDDKGRVHCQFNQAVTITSRLSSANPNLQNIPVRTDEGKRIRQSFIAPKGYTIVSADYSQIELRIMAHYSKDPVLLHAFKHGEDIHVATAAAVDGVDISQVTPEQRRQAKAVNFGLIYGMSAFGLSKQLGIDRSMAQDLIDRYFEKYPGVLKYMDQVRDTASEKGYVKTELGRRMYMPSAQSKNAVEKKAAMRAAINAPMQGSAAEIIKLAMLAVNEQMKDFDYLMTIQVHDELIFEVKDDQVDSFKKKVVQIMQSVLSMDVPLEVNVSSGNNWESAH